ncbi:MAG: PAS domain S-box protein [Candidatus Rokubacteria bacterium]|nr:PAS domain S-box protein [Candidatus Rokubacteria bacterium]
MKFADANRLLRIFSGARLGLAGLLLTLGPFLPPDLVPGTHAGMLAVSLLVVVVSAATVLTAGTFADPRRMTWLVSILDVVLVTAVVASTGGARSIFAFLYVLSVIAACVLLSRTGGLVVAGLASVLYIGLVFGRTVFPMTALFEPPAETTALEVLTMFLNTGTFLVVAIVAGGLAERFHETHEELELQRRDLRDVQAFRDLIFNSVGTGLIALDLSHVVTAFNPAAEEITGIPAATAVGRPGRTVLGDAVPFKEIHGEILRNPRRSVRYETAIRRPNGPSVPVRMTFSALASGDGHQLGLIAVCEDLSVIREMEARMRHADRLASLGRMAANIAHEIRNPLASLSGAIEVLAHTPAVADERERLSQIVLRESDRLNGIIRNFLDYARPAPLTRVEVNIAELVDEVLLLLEHGRMPAHVKIRRDFPGELRWPIDAQQFRQAVWNLALNAVEAMPEGGELAVTASARGDVLEVTVSDTGEGIPAAEQSQIFEPFFSTKQTGSGLGLALVHRVVSDHGGHVDLRSEPGLGTTFTLTLPRHHE